MIRLQNDTARAAASVVASHFIREPALAGKDVWRAGGTYEFELAKSGGAWRITAMTLARAWSEGNQDLPRLAAERAPPVDS
jgi:hypothetical protein